MFLKRINQKFQTRDTYNGFPEGTFDDIRGSFLTSFS